MAGNLMLLLFVVTGFAQVESVPAFPGAEGSGKFVTGGRGGQVMYVTNLEDNTSKGSLRYAINQSGPRIIVFKVSGTIKLKSRLNISNSNVTIAGQTAPGDGITIRDYPVVVNTDNVILRYLRFRMGDETNQEDDALGGRRHTDIIIDHCSMSWSTDECASFYDNEKFTLQWSILSESLRNSVHEKGKHGYGGIWGGRGVSFHHNLLAHHDSRNPRFCGSRYSNKPDEELIDYRNNVIYNWGANSAYAAEGGRYNMVNNYYKFGPATSKKNRIIEPYADNGGNSQPAGTYGTFYITGNYISNSQSVTNDNWLGVDMHSTFSNYAPGTTKDDLKSETEFPYSPVTTHRAEMAYEKVIQFCGASLAHDSVDIRVLHEAATGTVTYTDGGNGSTNGLVDTQDAVGGWPVLATANAPADTDEDGMPDEWEITNNLNPESANDAQLKSVDGVYPNIEVYLYSLVDDITTAQNEDAIYTAVNKIPVNKTELKAYWNNSSKELIINHTNNIIQLFVYSITGALVYQKQLNSSSVRMPIVNLRQGIHIVKIVDEKNQVYSEKIMNM
ncbi:T9SS type A sorting domain-containing protein [Prolixibacteraceae bacterium Z1-6]|uniref:T9SS type A sorting domain-containing protein n=1 Tax=Draconibacterium aestuarii TaxID=2998507 RepID=A0A9X3F9K8_9BACT|nr:T9SS type A sorting domain-containing protein [Prolixibacteraceae bacterium Z1-6]